MLTNQRETPAGKLHTDLVAAAGMEPDADKTFCSRTKCPELQTGFFDTFPFLFDHKNLVFAAVFEEKILPVAGFRRCAVNHGHIFFYHLSILHGFA